MGARRYADPLDVVWLAAAAQLGLRVERSDDVYAASDGSGVLRIGAAATLDADDCLAQMILHEICHWLVEGDGAQSKVDWGLDNVGDADLPREHAALRVQAALADGVGLRALLAPTTEHRAFYRALGADPLAGAADDRSAAAARVGVVRVSSAPWTPHVADALERTRIIANAARAAAEHLDADLLFARPCTAANSRAE